MISQNISTTLTPNIPELWPEILLGIFVAFAFSALLLLLKNQSLKTNLQKKQAEQARQELEQLKKELAQTRAEARQELTETQQLLVQMQSHAQDNLEQARLQAKKQHTNASQELQQILAATSQEQQKLQAELHAIIQEQLETKWVPVLEQIKTKQRQEIRQLQEKYEQNNQNFEAEYQQQQQKYKQAYEKLQAELYTAQAASSAKSKFVSNMSHDIRTLMNTITGMSNLAVRHVSNPQYTEDCLNKIFVASQQMLNLLNDILDMSRIECGKMELINKPLLLTELIHNMMIIIQEQAQDKKLRLLINTQNIQNECIISDQTRLMQILINILSNAVKFSETFDTILVHIGQEPSVQAGYGRYTFLCSDTGSGISSDFIGHIFDAFERDKTSAISKIEGSGLGLAITKHIVDTMGGLITCSSELGKGTTFKIILDFPVQGPIVSAEPIAQLQNLPALIVDDDINTYISASQILKEAGMQPQLAVCAQEAIKKTKEIYKKGGSCGLFLIEQLLPDSSFSEVTRQIRQIVGSGPPIIIMSAYNWSNIENEAYKVGVTAFLAKPLFYSSFNKKLLRIFDQEKPEEVVPQIYYDFSGIRILLVEDGEMNMEIAETIISETNAEISKAWNGQEALAAIQAQAPGYFDLVLMDIQMPLLDGYETTKQIRSLDRPDAPALPIIAMSANIFEEDIRRAKEAGMNDHIGKPIYPEDLFDTIKKYTARQTKNSVISQ